jgi:hypothetical protein
MEHRMYLGRFSNPDNVYWYYCFAKAFTLRLLKPEGLIGKKYNFRFTKSKSIDKRDKKEALVANRSHQAEQLHPSTLYLPTGRPTGTHLSVPSHESGPIQLPDACHRWTDCTVLCGTWYFHLFGGNDRALRESETQHCKKSSIMSRRIPCQQR